MAASRPAGDPVERELYARETQASATVTALLLLSWGAASISFVPRIFRVVDVPHTIVGALGLAYFWYTRKQPRPRVAAWYIALVIGHTIVLLPWIAIQWCSIGRPWEAVIVPQVGMLTVALLVPRSFALGVVVMLLFCGESVFVYFWARHVGLANWTGVGEPIVGIYFTLPSVAFLALRERRRRQARRYMHLSGENDALARLGPLFTRIREEMATQLARISGEVARLRPDGAAPLGDMARAVERLGDVNRRLGALVDQGAPPATAPPVDAPPNEAERAMLERDAWQGACVLSAIYGAVALAWSPVAMRDIDRFYGWNLFGLGVLGCAALGTLLLMRNRPSETWSRFVTVALVMCALPVISYDQWLLLAQPRPFAPLLGHKLLMVGVGLTAARSRWLSLGLIVLTLAVALGLYFYLDLDAHKDRITVVEPLVTVIFAVVGVAAMTLREQRRIGSLRLLRAEAAASTLHQRAVMLLALRDQLNSPLQTLLLTAAHLEALEPGQDLTTLRECIARLTALSRELARVEVPSESVAASLDTRRLRKATA